MASSLAPTVAASSAPQRSRIQPRGGRASSARRLTHVAPASASRAGVCPGNSAGGAPARPVRACLASQLAVRRAGVSLRSVRSAAAPHRRFSRACTTVCAAANAGSKEPGSSGSDGRWGSVVNSLANTMEPAMVESLLDEVGATAGKSVRARLSSTRRESDKT